MKTLKYTKLDGKFIINFSEVCNHHLQIDNNYFTFNHTDKEIVFEKLPSDIYIIRENKVITQYKNISNEILTVDDFTFKINVLKSKGTYDEGEGLLFSNLEDEFVYRKFLRDWIPEYKIFIEQIEKVILEEVSVLQQSEKYIFPLRHFGENIVNPICVLDIKLFELIDEVAKEFGFVQVSDNLNCRETEGFKWSCPNFSGWDYLKINNHYINLDKGEKFTCRGTYEECSAKLSDIKSKLRTAFLKEKIIIDNKPISNLILNNIFLKLKIIKTVYNKVECTKKTYSHYINLGKEITTLDNAIVNQLNQQEQIL